jgi:hypothetical protein
VFFVVVVVVVVVVWTLLFLRVRGVFVDEFKDVGGIVS